MNRMNARLTPRVALGCVFVEKRKVVGLEEILLQQVRTPAIERWDKAAVIIEDDVGGYADFLMEQVQNGLKVQLREELRPDDSFWKAQRRRFAQRMDELLHQIVSGLHLESDLKPVLVKSRRLAAVQLLVVLPALIGAIVLASLGKWTLAGVVEGTGLVLGGVLWFASGRLLSAARQKAADKLTLARPELRKFLTEQLRDDVRNLYDSFNRILEPTREKLLDKEKRQTAFTEQVENLVNSFNVLDAQLREMSAAGG